MVTEAGFGADIGMEKFFNIKCRYSGECLLVNKIWLVRLKIVQAKHFDRLDPLQAIEGTE